MKNEARRPEQTDVFQPLAPSVEASLRVPESEAIWLSINPASSPLILRYGEEFRPNAIDMRLDDKKIKRYDSVVGELTSNSEQRHVGVLIRWPSFIERAVSRAKNREPRADIHLTIQ